MAAAIISGKTKLTIGREESSIGDRELNRLSLGGMRISREFEPVDVSGEWSFIVPLQGEVFQQKMWMTMNAVLSILYKKQIQEIPSYCRNLSFFIFDCHHLAFTWDQSSIGNAIGCIRAGQLRCTFKQYHTTLEYKLQCHGNYALRGFSSFRSLPSEKRISRCIRCIWTRKLNNVHGMIPFYDISRHHHDHYYFFFG